MTHERQTPIKIVLSEGGGSSGHPANDASPRGEARRKPLSLRRKLIFASVATLIFFAGLEGVLRVIVAPTVTRREDPFVGFVGSTPLFETLRDGEVTVAKTAPSKQTWFNEQRFPIVKPPDTIRVVCLGGSTTYGRPFNDRTSFAGWLRELLPLADPVHDWEVINAGGISYASYRVARVMEELAFYDVDIFIVYTGQNEFLEWRTYGDWMERDPSIGWLSNAVVEHTRIGSLLRSGLETTGLRSSSRATRDSRFRLPGEVDEMLNHSIGPENYQRDTAWAESVVSHFEHNLDRMRQTAIESGARFVLVTPISKLRDCSPFKSDFGMEVSGPARTRLGGEVQRAESLVRGGEFASALEVLDAVLSEDREHAGVHYLRGQALFGLGQFEAARTAYDKAIDLDVCPLRATAPIRQALRRVASEDHVIRVATDTWLERELRREFGHNCPGSESFLDHVHPTIEVHRGLATEIIRALRESGVGLSELSTEQLAETNHTILGRIDKREMGVAYRNLAKLWHWCGKFSEAISVARDALRLIPEDLETRFVLADSLATLGESDEAIRQYDALFERGDYPPALLTFGELLLQRGHPTAAKAFLLQAVLVDEGERLGRVYFLLGQSHETLGENELAVDCFVNAQELLPQNAQVSKALRRSKSATKETPEKRNREKQP
ncbi:MAG: tetratricopeptide repeat protein [Planctomycetota bacterium]